MPADGGGDTALATLVRRHRRQAGLSQRKLAELLELDPDTISNLERGRTRPYEDTVARLCQALKLDHADRAQVWEAWRALSARAAKSPSRVDDAAPSVLQAEVQDVFTQLEAQCRNSGCQMTRLHVLHALFSVSLSMLPEPPRAAVQTMLAEAEPILFSRGFRQTGFLVTDSVRALLGRAARAAQSHQEPQVTVRRVLDCLLDEPGTNVELLLSRYGLSPPELQLSLSGRFSSLPVRWVVEGDR